MQIFKAAKMGGGLNYAAEKKTIFQVVQKDVQWSVGEVDRTKRVYFSEESDALEVATKAQA